jgi:hypothetical protein
MNFWKLSSQASKSHQINLNKIKKRDKVGRKGRGGGEGQGQSDFWEQKFGQAGKEKSVRQPRNCWAAWYSCWAVHRVKWSWQFGKIAKWHCGVGDLGSRHGNVDFAIWQSGVGKCVKASWQNTQMGSKVELNKLAKWSQQMGKGVLTKYPNG